MLLSEYDQRKLKKEVGKLRKKKAFDEISDAMMQKGYAFTSDQCATRMKTMLRAYKLVKDHNKVSGNQPKTYPYEKELDEIFGKHPNVNPVFVLSTLDDNMADNGEEKNKKEKDKTEGDKDNTRIDDNNNNEVKRKAESTEGMRKKKSGI